MDFKFREGKKEGREIRMSYRRRCYFQRRVDKSASGEIFSSEGQNTNKVVKWVTWKRTTTMWEGI